MTIPAVGIDEIDVKSEVVSVAFIVEAVTTPAVGTGETVVKSGLVFVKLKVEVVTSALVKSGEVVVKSGVVSVELKVEDGLPDGAVGIEENLVSVVVFSTVVVCSIEVS